nr:hypothetical protein [Candidatus Sigynarchaeota archaeon]
MTNMLSKGLLLTREKLKSITVPQQVLDQFTADTNNYLVIFNPRSDNLKISIIPCRTREILKVLVHLTEFSPQTVKNIADIIYDLKISTVHTSGICFHEKECAYEAYIEMDKKGTIMNTIKDKFSKIPQCKNVDLEIIKIE